MFSFFFEWKVIGWSYNWGFLVPLPSGTHKAMSRKGRIHSEKHVSYKRCIEPFNNSDIQAFPVDSVFFQILFPISFCHAIMLIHSNWNFLNIPRKKWLVRLHKFCCKCRRFATNSYGLLHMHSRTSTTANEFKQSCIRTNIRECKVHKNSYQNVFIRNKNFCIRTSHFFPLEILTLQTFSHFRWKNTSLASFCSHKTIYVSIRWDEMSVV